MNKTANEINILWLSDIHFKEDYGNNNRWVKELIDLFIIKLFEVQKDQKPVSHVVFTGDLVFTAKNSQDYTAFNDYLLSNIKTACPDAQYLFVPGNHDVQWNSVLGLFTASKKSPQEFFKYNSRIDDVKYNEIFNTFSYQPFVSLTDKIRSEQDKVEIDKGGRFGYYYDSSNNYLFLLINSSYLSFGQIPGDSIVGKIKEEVLDKGYQTFIAQVIESAGHLLAEYGNQTYALYLFEKYIPAIEDILKQKPVVISLAHHPPEWIYWSEKHASDANSFSQLDRFLFEYSNLHLVGHEHSTPTIGSRHGQACLLLRAGMFLDNSVENEPGKDKKPHERFPNNWFALLKIGSSGLVHRRFTYRFEDGKPGWKEMDSYNYRNPNPPGGPVNYIPSRKPISTVELNTNREKNVPTTGESDKFECRLMDIALHQFDYFSYFTTKCNIPIGPENEKKLESFALNGLDYRILTYTDNKSHPPSNVVRVLFTNLGKCDYSNHDGICLNGMFELLKEITTKQTDLIPVNDSTIFIVSIFDFYDLHPDPSSLEIPGVREEMGRVIEENELKYNVFKHHFFAKLKRNKALFKALHEMKFTYLFLYVKDYPTLIHTDK